MAGFGQPPPIHPARAPVRAGGTSGGGRRRGVTPAAECGPIEADRAVLTTRQEDMRHPSHVWVDPEYAREPIDKLRVEYQ